MTRCILYTYFKVSLIITGEIVPLIPYSILPLDTSDCTKKEGKNHS